MATELIVVTTTTDDRTSADRIAERLVASRLAACVQISGPVTSAYIWKGAFEQTQEWLVQIKTRADHFEGVRQTIESLHPYDTPEILAVPAVAASDRYATWIEAQT